MNILKKENIFTEINKKKSIFTLNVSKHFGNRVIDALIHNLCHMFTITIKALK